MQVFNEKIPKEKFNQWHILLKQTEGRYIYNPIVLDTFVLVSYEPGDYNQQQEGWKRMTAIIKEKRSDQTWRKFARRVLCSRLV